MSDEAASGVTVAPWLVSYWDITTTWVMMPIFVLTVGFSLYMMLQSLRINYYYYIKCGDFLFLIPDKSSDAHRLVNQICMEKGIDDDYAPWFFTLFLCLVVIVIGVIASIIWPIALTVFAPLTIVWAFAKNKRKKNLFVEKLQGEK